MTLAPEQQSVLEDLGIPSLNISYGGEDSAGIYHSVYDDFYFYTHFLDTDFAYGRTLAQTAGTAVIRLADADILPFHYSNLADTVRTYDEELQLLLKKLPPTQVLVAMRLRSSKASRRG